MNDALNKDLLKNKYFVGFLVVLGIGALVVWLINSNSVESKCRRYYEKLGSMLGSSQTQLGDLQLKSASEPLIQECIKNGGPN